ncbi:MAG: geranylgeranyl reductase family protein [Candidatus Cloacimonetes bacterium]|nr:geranylgeranyl reductase family protein [Candidatus Cloacimonadota bacterium]
MKINKDLCDICGTCPSVCPVEAIKIKEFEVLIDNEKCKKCQNCVKICPVQAIYEQQEAKEPSQSNLSKETNFISKNEIKHPIEYDAIVIGAGPAGSVAARFLAENGCSVLILERDREPGIPVRCAEGVSHNGILPYIEIDERWISATIDGARLHSPNGDSLDMYNNGTGYVLDRRVFDRSLADLAVSKGAILQTKADAVGLLRDSENKIIGVKYRHENSFIDVRSKIVIGADGIESQVGRWAGFDTCLKLSDLEICCQYTVNNIKIEKHLCQFYFGKEVAPGGYLWIFPKSETQANIGIGIAGIKSLPGKGPRYYLDKFMEKHYPQASINYMIYGGVPTRAGNDFVRQNVMLVGDAAHQVNPITGGGTVQAMMGGHYCGETAAKLIKQGNITEKSLKKYNEKWENRFGQNQRFMYALKSKFFGFDDNKFNSIVSICKKIPRDDFNLQSLFKETIKEDPILLAQLATAFLVSKVTK